jgi:hypothetical protein
LRPSGGKIVPIESDVQTPYRNANALDLFNEVFQSVGKRNAPALNASAPLFRSMISCAIRVTALLISSESITWFRSFIDSPVPYPAYTKNASFAGFSKEARHTYVYYVQYTLYVHFLASLSDLLKGRF